MPFYCDFGVLTVVPEAFEAAIDLFACEQFEDELGLRWGVTLVPANGGGQHVVAIGQTVDRSNVPAAETASDMLRACNPRHLIIADIGAGFCDEKGVGRDGLALGDVVVANDIQGYEVLKEAPEGNRLREPSIQLPATGPRSVIRTLPTWFPEWHQLAGRLWPPKAPGRTPRILDGQVVSGEKLLTNPESELVERLAATYDKALGLDMESAGVGRAVLERQKEGIYAELTVLRGISDFVNKKTESNQKTRDDWKPFAAWAAIAAVRTWIGSKDATKGVIATGKTLPPKLVAAVGDSAFQSGRRQLEPDVAARFLDLLRPWLRESVLLSEAAFGLSLLPTEHRTANSALSASTAVERGELLDHVLNDRRVVVAGPSGAGKSYLLRQVLRQAAAQDEPIPIYIDLKESWRTEWGDRLIAPATDAEVGASMDALLQASPIDVTASDLAEMSADRQVVLIVDALNEVPAEAAALIRQTLDQCVRHHRNVRVLLGDRRSELFYRESQWSVLHLTGVTASEARNVVDDRFGQGVFDGLPPQDQRVLRLPFFLDRAIESGQVRLGSRTRAVHEFLREAGLRDSDIDLIAPIAFGVFTRGEISLNDADVASLEERNLLSPLQNAAILIEGSSGLIFSHQLVHQFLAGRHLAATEGEWTYQTLDKVTADSASPDTVGMTIASIEDRSRRDRFLSIVYDWQWRAAILALGEAQHGDRPVSEALSAALLALAAEKRFDAVRGTRERIDGLLGEVPRHLTGDMRTVTTSEDLLDRVAGMHFSDAPWWPKWREVFLWRPETVELTDRELALIGSGEPLIGWTVANALRRFKVSDEHAAVLRTIFRSQLRDESGACATRWRVVHAVGVWPSRENAEFLFDAITDEYGWVVYGAVRSLVEMAALTTDPDLRGWILDQLDARSGDLPTEPLSQIPWAATYRDADSSWPRVVRPLLHAIRDRQTGGERDRWDRRIETFEQYASERGN